jgi:hypothetical protein
MNRRPEHLVYRWLHSIKIPVSKTFLKEQLLSHPGHSCRIISTIILNESNIEGKGISDDHSFNKCLKFLDRDCCNYKMIETSLVKCEKPGKDTCFLFANKPFQLR